MSIFKEVLLEKLSISLQNDYDDNFELLRFPEKKKKGLKSLIREKYIFPNYVAKWKSRQILNKSHSEFVTLLSDLESLEWVYYQLSDQFSKELFIELIAYRVLGERKVKLSVNNYDYPLCLKAAEGLKRKKMKTLLNGSEVYFYDLKKIGYDLSFYYNTLGVVYDFMLEQYAYNKGDKKIFAKKGDYVIEAGGCWGNSALYFSSKVQDTGKVFSFEFIPRNLSIYKRNMEFNPGFANNISLIKHPLWDVSGEKVYFFDQGAGSHVSFEPIENCDGTTSTISIDDFVKDNDLKKLDFIALDVEGAELQTLKGAQNSIKEFKPDLAISIYHNFKDFSEIPKWIFNQNLGYKFYLGHYSIYSEETILFATCEK